MIHSDRDRTLIGAGSAILVHVVIFGLMAIFGLLDPSPYPETEAVFVTLPDYDPPPEPEPEPEPEEIAAAEPQPEPRTSQPQSQSPTPRAQPRSSSPATQRRASPAEPSPSTEAAPGTAAESMPWLDQPQASDRADDGTTDEELFTFEEDQADADLPDWVRAGEYSIQPEESLTPSEQATIEEKRETLPGFEERLDRFVSAVNAPEGPASAPSPEQTGNTNASRQQISGDSAIEWFGSGPRTVTDYSEPRLTAADFGGQVPARVNYIVIFDVDAAGRVVPGTLIVRQSSGYTQADQKVRQAILGWRFEPSPSAPTVTAIATLQITRDEIR